MGFQPHKLVLVAWSQAGPRSMNFPRHRSGEVLTWAGVAGGTEESSSFWDHLATIWGENSPEKEPAGSRDGQGGQQEILGTAIPPSDTAC